MWYKFRKFLLFKVYCAKSARYSKKDLVEEKLFNKVKKLCDYASETITNFTQNTLKGFALRQEDYSHSMQGLTS